MDDLRYRGLVRTRRVREGHRWTLWYRLADEIVFLPDPTPVPEPVRIF
jgi:hypothetical protein